MKRLSILGLLVAALFAASASPAWASVGVGTNVKSIAVSQTLEPGGTYPLAPFDIINTGSKAFGYKILLATSQKGGQMVGAGWLTFSPKAFFLQPNGSANVSPTLHLPADASPGNYRVRLLGVPTIAGGPAGGRIGVGVGPTLVFHVGAPSLWQSVAIAFQRFMPWSAILVVVLVLVLCVGVATTVVMRQREPEGLAGGA